MRSGNSYDLDFMKSIIILSSKASVTEAFQPATLAFINIIYKQGEKK